MLPVIQKNLLVFRMTLRGGFLFFVKAILLAYELANTRSCNRTHLYVFAALYYFLNHL
jgi:hypothetical protein